MEFDLAVVGGGHNGLVCAAYAARAGLSVVVIERERQIGGAAITEEFHAGFRNSAASYTVSLLQPRIIAELELARHGLSIVQRPLANFVPALDGPGLELPDETSERTVEIAKHSRRDAERYPQYSAELERVTALVRPFILEAPIEPASGLSELRRAIGVALRTLGHGPRAIATALQLFRHSAGERLDRYFESDLLKGGLGFDSIVGHFASPYTRGSGYLLLHHAVGGVNDRRGSWGHAIGGMGAISDALAAAAREHGVVIRTDEPAERIDVDAGRFRITTGKGAVSARSVAAAVHPRRLFVDLLPDAALPAAFRRRIEAWKSESASFRINVALSELPDFRCLPGRRAARHHGSGILIAPSLAYLDRAHRTALADGVSAEPIVELVIPSVIDGSLAPRGRHVASLFCQHFRYALPDGASWDTRRDAVLERIIGAIDDYAPNFKRSIIAAKAYSPVDLERRFGLVGGDIFHGAMIRGQLYRSRPARAYARYRTPIPRLYLCASGAHPGGGVSGAPGYNAARALLEDRAIDDRRPGSGAIRRP